MIMQILKRFAVLTLFVAGVFIPATSMAGNDDSLLFIQLKKDFVAFEREHGRYIQTKNVKMHYLSWGKPTGVPFVWLHGTGNNAYEFYGFADSLVKLGYQVIAIDYYGHGLTPIPAKEVSIYHVADDVKFLLDYLKIKKAIIGGFSRGGSIATAFYDAYPAYVCGIILQDGGSVAWPTMEHKLSIDSMYTKTRNDFKEFEQSANTTFDTEFEAIQQTANLKNKGRVFYALAAVKQNSAGKWAAHHDLDEFLGESSADTFLDAFYRPFASPHLFGTSTTLLYPKIIYRNLDVPMLILDPVSTNDRFDFEAENAKLQKTHPTLITHKVYPNTSHGLMFQRPKEFLADLTAFMATVKAFKQK